MSLGEAIVDTIIILITAIIVISAAATSTVVRTAEVPEVQIVWQQHMIHNAINNPYVELTDKKPETDPDASLILQAGSVPYSND